MLLPSIALRNCDDAISYYKEILGAQVKTISYFRDAPSDCGLDESTPPNYVMYSEVLIHGATMCMTDGSEPIPSESFWFTLMFDTPEEVADIFNKLADGGEVVEAPKPQFWAASNAYVIDRFGMFWNILTKN